MTSQKKPRIKTIEREIGKKYLLDLLQNNKKKKKNRQMGKDYKEFTKKETNGFSTYKRCSA